MAEQVNGYRPLLAQDYDTYDHWRNYALTHGVNVDWSYGNQCWDICALLWNQYSLRLETGNGYAYGCWVYRRDQNARVPFTKVEHVRDIKRGDCLVFAPSGLNYTGHICFADADFSSVNSMPCLGQNQGQGTRWGTPSNIVNMSLRNFLGGFRNSNWKSEEPVHYEEVSKDAFPWVLYARKFRKRK